MKGSSGKNWSFELPADHQGIFLERPNRFLALVDLSGKAIQAHVHDPGRLPQILKPGTKVLLRHAPGPKRKTSWDLLAGEAEGSWVLVHSGVHRPLIQKLLQEKGPELFPGLLDFQPEPRLEDGRLDYLLFFKEGHLYVETKGCTLSRGEIALFPDAPTSRGTRHLKNLVSLKKDGARALLWFLVFRPETKCFAPAREIDPQFAAAFEEALQAGVEIKITKFRYDGEKITLLEDLPLCE